MKAISLWQPWATLVAIGAKRIETRSWSTKHRGPIAIHASAGAQGRLSFDAPDFRDALNDAGYETFPTLPFGSVVAVANLVDVRPMFDRNCRLMGDWWSHYLCQTEDGINVESSFGDYRPGRYAWLLEDIHALVPPALARGRQGIWNWETGTSGYEQGQA